ncbi:inositol monophosphatase family protein [Rubellimicrobium sp. CFH 75288]|uniref:inositol monophosphatase family protein n=1 Tax=Rubellimicrobium sp. CFH 75288 TaxID=2697034 RepID=UPI001AA143DB|nr:inositol monophosphatase family protein [Rubellimicrobium sp. CFH 75288]
MIRSRPQPADLLPAVIDMVRQAGALIRAEFHRAGGPRGGGSKAPIDVEVEQLLRDRLLALHACGFVGEETGRAGPAEGDVWVVDPQDGTTDFLARRRGSAVSVALLRDGHPVLGVVFAPLAPDDRGDLIAWAEGTALTRNGLAVRRPVRSHPPVVAMNANAADYARHNHEALRGIRVRAIASPAYRLALAAAGEVDAGLSLVAGLDHWDIAGAHALLIGAGCTLVERTGKAVDYGRRHFDGCIGGAADVVAMLVELGPGPSRREQRNGAIPRARIADPDRLARAQGCLLGQLAGDALGSAVEFRSAADIARSHPEGVTRLTDGGTWNLIAGQPTDDSEMALALARALADQGRFDPATVGQAYIGWARSGPFDIGGTTAAGIAALARGRPASSDSQSNGALMRVSPVGIFAAGDPALAAKLAAEDARLTHPHPVCQAASAAFAAAVATGVAGGTAAEMAAAAEQHAGEGEGARIVRQRLAAARRDGPENFERQMGWVLIAFQNAFDHLNRGTPVAEAVSATVARGGDTDTNAAICGALLGASQGREAIPLQWRNAVLSCRPVQGSGIRHPRPSEYWPDDALDLAEALLAAGPSGG